MSPALIAVWHLRSHTVAVGIAQETAARWIAANTPERSVFVADAFINSPVDLAGRLRITTFGPYVSNLGYDPAPRETDTRAIYCDGPLSLKTSGEWSQVWRWELTLPNAAPAAPTSRRARCSRRSMTRTGHGLEAGRLVTFVGVGRPTRLCRCKPRGRASTGRTFWRPDARSINRSHQRSSSYR
jgi:hypothetical protein